MIVAISQRHKSDHGAIDALETSYIEYFSSFGITLIPIPNNTKYVKAYFEALRIDGIILSGGGDVQPVLYGGTLLAQGSYSAERDDTEEILLTIAREQDIPVLGICRGMEFINVHFGGKIQSTADTPNTLEHDETRHLITLSDESLTRAVGRDVEVNSYHRMVIASSQLASSLTAFATASDHTIEGLYHPEFALAAIAWHPERETTPSAVNALLIDAFLSRKLFWKKRKAVTT